MLPTAAAQHPEPCRHDQPVPPPHPTAGCRLLERRSRLPDSAQVQSSPPTLTLCYTRRPASSRRRLPSADLSPGVHR
ncbi:unnamed protein product [Gadus morhua 'NCC']